MNLILAFFWLALALCAFVGSFIQAEVVIMRKEISLPWVAGISLAMFGYNLLRWWLSRVQQRDREVMKQISGRLRRHEDERNPDFDFTDDR